MMAMIRWLLRMSLQLHSVRGATENFPSIFCGQLRCGAGCVAVIVVTIVIVTIVVVIILIVASVVIGRLWCGELCVGRHRTLQESLTNTL